VAADPHFTNNAFAIDEEGGGNTLNPAESLDKRRIIVEQDHFKGETAILGKFADFVLAFPPQGHPHDHQVIGVFLAKSLEMRHRYPAGPAPGVPEIDDDRLATQAGKLEFAAIEPFEGKIGRGAPLGAGRSGGLGGGCIFVCLGLNVILSGASDQCHQGKGGNQGKESLEIIVSAHRRSFRLKQIGKSGAKAAPAIMNKGVVLQLNHIEDH
jgi:hypothetical protein